MVEGRRFSWKRAHYHDFGSTTAGALLHKIRAKALFKATAWI